MGITHNLNPNLSTMSGKPSQLRAYSVAEPGTTSAQNDANAWKGVTPLQAPSFAEANAAFSAQQLGASAAPDANQPWKTVTTMRTDSVGAPIQQNLYKQGNSYSDKPMGLRTDSPPPQQSMPSYSGSVGGRPAIPGGKMPMNNFDMTQLAPQEEPSITVSANPSSNPLYRVGMRTGGEYEDGEGGLVPGPARGDKFKAKYEGGEFVVSNDMLDAEPELRSHLRGLREVVLAEKGMTPEQADAKALNGGKGLRAESSFGGYDPKSPLVQQELARAQAMKMGFDPRNPAISSQLREAAPEIPIPADRVRTAERLESFNNRMNRPGAPAPMPEATPTPPNSGPPKPPGGYRAGQKAALLMRGAGRAVPVLAGGYELASGMDEGDGWKMAKGAGDMAAGAALATPAAPIAAGYLGLRGVYEGAKAVAPMVSDYFMRDKDKAVADMLNPPQQKTNLREAGDPFKAANDAKLAKFKTEWDKYNAPGELGATRNFDHSGNLMPKGQEMYYTGPKMGWQQRTTEKELAKLNADKVKWQREMSGRPDPMMNPAMFGHMLKAQEIQLAQANADRSYGLDVAKHGQEVASNNASQKIAANRDWDDHASKIFQTKDSDGKIVPDAKLIADYTQATDATIGKMIPSLLNSKDPEKVAYGKLLAAKGRTALDDQDRADMTKHFQRMDLARKSYGISPLAGSGGTTNDLRTYADRNMRAQKGNIFQERVEFVDPDTGEPVGSTPRVNMQHGPDANHIFGNWSSSNNSLR